MHATSERRVLLVPVLRAAGWRETRTLTVADIAIAERAQRTWTIAAYVGMVYDAWIAPYRDVISEWYDRYVLRD
jgi:hypothetical protein